MEKHIDTEVLIVGAGSTGAAIARELSKYKVDTTLVEKNVDVCSGETRFSHGGVYSSIGLSWASSLVLKSLMAKPGETLLHPDSLKEQLTLKGFNKFDSIAQELDISSYRRLTRIMLATDDDEVKRLKEAERLCQETGVEPRRLSRDDVLGLEPNVTQNVICGILDSTSQANLYPWDYVIALAENAKANGVRILLGAEVEEIKPLNGGFAVNTKRGPIKTRFLINAAGAYADRVAQMAGVCDFGLKFVKSQMLVLDKRIGGLINNAIGAPPSPGEPRSIKPTSSGNILTVCHRYTPVEDREDASTRKEWGQISITGAQTILPDISERDIITSFSGVRVFNTRDPEDHLIETSAKNPHFINAVVRLPGLAPSPAIAEHVLLLLANQGLALSTKTDFNAYRKGMPRIRTLCDEEKAQLISQDPKYGHIVCRCEQITEGEIVEAIRRGARTIAGIKYRTRAGMGRCQRNYCGPRIMEILARELNVPMTELTQKGGLSHLLLHRSEELLN